MTTIEMQYKADTGNSSHLKGIESDLMIKTIDIVILEGMTGKEIIDLLKYDNIHNMSWCIEMNQIPDEYKEENDLHLINPEYVKWLEEKVMELQKSKP